MPARLNKRELATVLAALRSWQQNFTHDEDGPIDADHFDDTITPLSVGEIDELCERLNFDAA